MLDGVVKESISEQGPNKRAGWNFFKKLISEQGQIRVSRMEKPEKINKRACSFIRQVRVRESELIAIRFSHCFFSTVGSP